MKKNLFLLMLIALSSSLLIYYFVSKGRHGVKPSPGLGDQSGNIVQDTWEAAYYLDGSRAGNIHTEVRETETPKAPSTTTMW